MFRINLTETLAPRSRTTVVGGADTMLSVQEWGNPNGKPIVFAHAFGTNHLGWKPGNVLPFSMYRKTI